MKTFFKKLLNFFTLQPSMSAEERYYSTAKSLPELEEMMKQVQRGTIKFHY